MFKHISTTSRAGRSLRFSSKTYSRLLHCDAARLSRVYYLPHLDIAPRSQASPINPGSQGFLPHAPVISRVETGLGPDNKVTKIVTVNIKLLPILKWTALLLGTALVYDVFWKRWKSIGARVELMKRIVNDAPDIDTLREDEEAMANHLYALMHVCLPNELQHDAAKALARYRVQGDEGRAIIEAVCKQINAVFKEEDLGRVKLLYKVTIIITRFINPNATRLPRVNGAVNTESPSSSDPNVQSTDYRPLQ